MRWRVVQWMWCRSHNQPSFRSSGLKLMVFPFTHCSLDTDWDWSMPGLLCNSWPIVNNGTFPSLNPNCVSRHCLITSSTRYLSYSTIPTLNSAQTVPHVPSGGGTYYTCCSTSLNPNSSTFAQTSQSLK